MKKKYLVLWILLIILVLAFAVGCGIYFISGGRYQSVSIKGYGLQVPAAWEVTTEENTLNFTYKNEEQGSFSLLYDDAELSEIPSLFGFSAEELAMRESDQYATKVYELSFHDENEPVVQYVFDGLPMAPPFKLVLTLRSGSERLAQKILPSIKLPNVTEFAPVKPLSLPDGAELEEMVYIIQNEYGLFSYNISMLESRLQQTDLTTLNDLHVLSFYGQDGERNLKTWYCLTTDGTKQYLFTYYQSSNGQYIYDNDPQIFDAVTKETSKEENYTRYLAGEIIILETPYNQYAEQKDALLQYKGTQAEDRDSVQALIMKALPAGVVLEDINLQTTTKPYGLTLKYTLTKADQYIKNGQLDESGFYQNALMLFSLIDDVDQIFMEIRGNNKTYKVDYKRKTAEKQFNNQDLRDFANDEDDFTKFTEEVPNVTPPEEDGSVGKTEGTRAIKSRTITLYADTLVSRPEYGDQVYAGPYAKKYGFSQYLGKPVQVTLYEKVKAGKTTMWAAGVCEGVEIGVYPVKSEAEFDSMMSIFN